MYYMI